jgi:cysteine desulfurase family protein (TIGR01976 family)
MMLGMVGGSGVSAVRATESGAASIDLDWVRANFPALAKVSARGPVVYLDNPAGTQVPLRCIDAISSYLSEGSANSHGCFESSRQTDEIIAEARRGMAALLGGEPHEIAFGPNMTTLTYALSRALARRFEPGDEVIVSELDHDANVSPWLALEERGVVVRQISISPDDCTLDLAAFERLLSQRTRLVAVGHSSNALGTINPVARIAELAHRAGALVWVDAVHSAPHVPLDVHALGADFLVCSAYKFFGPHLGILWGRAELLEQVRAYQVRPAPQTSPEKLETGTKNHECLAGLVGTLEYLRELGRRAGAPAGDARGELLSALGAIQRHELDLSLALSEGLASVPGLRLYGIGDRSRFAERVPTFSFTIDGLASAEISERLAAQSIYSWAGNYYAFLLMQRLGLAGGAVRVGAVHYNTVREVERLLEVLRGLARR